MTPVLPFLWASLAVNFVCHTVKDCACVEVPVM